MKKILLLTLLLMTLAEATKYEIVHLKRGKTVNVRDLPSISNSKVVGKIAAYSTEISIRECQQYSDASEWCYIKVPRGGSHLEGWVSSYYLAPMSKTAKVSRLHIQNFLRNFYLADEEDFLDKLQVFYSFPMQKYLWSKNVSLMALRQKKVRFYKKWSKRHYRMTYLKILKRKPNYIDVQTTVRWKLKGYDDYEAGKDIQKLRLVPTGNSFKVAAMKYLRHTVYPKPKPVVDENLTILDANQTDVNGSSEVPKTMMASNKFYIKAGSFFSEINSNYLTKIKANGFNYIIQKVAQDDKLIRRVFIGPFDSVLTAGQALKKVRANINELAYIQSSHLR
jgi:cell division septation protein DedD